MDSTFKINARKKSSTSMPFISNSLGCYLAEVDS